MQNNISSLLKELRAIATVYDGQQAKHKIQLLQSLRKHTPSTAKQWLEYNDLLLFMAAHPENEIHEQETQRAIKQFNQQIKNSAEEVRDTLRDSGILHTQIVTRFTHDLLSWLITDNDCKVVLDSFDKKGTELNELLRLTLPTIEHEETMAGKSNEELFETLGVKPARRLEFLLDEFNHFNEHGLLKDHLWDAMKVYVSIYLKNIEATKHGNRFLNAPVFYQSQIIKKFDHHALLSQPLPAPTKLDKKKQEELIKCIRRSLLLTIRETDPTTYLHEASLRYYELERGVAIAIYGMPASRQLALQSYIGYTLFKNGYPVAYGGSWIFGRAALFGINIFDPYRGGESGMLMCQLLRVYRMAFGVDYFEVEPYQYGKDNPDGIQSGAFWFYHRFGFQPVDKELNLLAQKEAEKIKSKKGYRSSEQVLHRFTESNIALHLSGNKPIRINDIAPKITAMISKRFHASRVQAMKECSAILKQKLGTSQRFNEEEKIAFKEMALLAEYLNINDAKRLDLCLQLIRSKPSNPYLYNELLKKLIG